MSILDALISIENGEAHFVVANSKTSKRFVQAAGFGDGDFTVEARCDDKTEVLSELGYKPTPYGPWSREAHCKNAGDVADVARFMEDTARVLEVDLNTITTGLFE